MLHAAFLKAAEEKACASLPAVGLVRTGAASPAQALKLPTAAGLNAMSSISWVLCLRMPDGDNRVNGTFPMPKDSWQCAGTQELGPQPFPASSVLLRARTSAFEARRVETQAPKPDSGRHSLQVEKALRGYTDVYLCASNSSQMHFSSFLSVVFFAHGQADSAPVAAGGVS